MIEIETFDCVVTGRPAPQGSKKKGDHGAMREASVYLAPWRRAIRKAILTRYVELGVTIDMLRERPVFIGAVAYGGTFWMPNDHRVDSPPDLDKLLRAVWDVLTATRVWEDDGRVVKLRPVVKQAATDDQPAGCYFYVEPVERL